MTVHFSPRISVGAKFVFIFHMSALGENRLWDPIGRVLLSAFLQPLKLSSLEVKSLRFEFCQNSGIILLFVFRRKENKSVFLLSFASCYRASVSLAFMCSVTENIMISCRYFLSEEVGNGCWSCICLCIPGWKPKAAVSPTEFIFKKEGRKEIDFLPVCMDLPL